MTNTNISKDFSKATIKALRTKGIIITGSTWLPGTDGTFANGERGYILVSDGMQMLRTYLQVKGMAA